MYTELIKSKLRALNISFKSSGTHYLLSQCLNPHHKDEHGSFSINTQTASCHCFTCGFKADSNFFTNGKVSEEQEEELKRQSDYFKLKEKLKNDAIGLNSFSGLPIKDNEVEDGFRGLTKETIKKFGLYECHTGRYSNRVVFPFDNNEGFTSRTYDKESKAKYLHSKGFDNKNSLYPFNLLKNDDRNYVVVVEGIMDCISMWQEDIPSMCNFGVADNFGNSKIGKLLECGIEILYVVFDNDAAGKEASEKLLNNKLLNEYFEVKEGKGLKELEGFYLSETKDFNEYIMEREDK